MRFVLSFIAALVVLPGLTCAADPSFATDVYPIFRQQCWSCHSGDKPKGALRFDGEVHLRKGGESGPLFVPGKPDASNLIEQVSGDKPAMPPEWQPLKQEQVEILRKWIAAGAKIDRMPVDTLPTVKIPQTYDYAPPLVSVAFHPDGKRAAVACRSEAVIVTLEGDAPPVRLATESDFVSHVEFSPDGAVLAAAGGTPGQFGEVRFFDVAKGTVIVSRRASSDTLFRGNFAPDGKSIALGAADGAVYIVPLDAKLDVKRLDLHSDWVVDVAWTPDGSKLISAGRDKTTKVASVASGELLRTVDTAQERMNAVVADDQLAVSAGLVRNVTGYQLGVALQNVEVSGAGNGSRPVSRREQYIKAFEGFAGEVLDLALSGDRKALAVAGRASEVRLYTLADQKRLAAVAKVTAPAYCIALNKDATRLLVGGKSGQLEVYELPTGKLLKSIAPVPVKSAVAAK